LRSTLLARTLRTNEDVVPGPSNESPVTLPRTLAIGLAAAALLPAAAEADVTMVSRDVPLTRESAPLRALAAAEAPLRFNMVGLHWQGPGSVWFRTAGEDGWSAWQAAEREEEDAPDADSPEGRSGAWKVGNPFWTGSANRIQYRVAGKVVRLRAYFIQSDVTDERASSAPARTQEATLTASPPRIIRRRQWGANESIVRNAPYYAERVVYASVHHTAGTNSYTAAQAAAIVRGIQRFHVLANGWDDIGYNFLVSKYGQVFEGRRGGINRPVVGAHARGFNTGAVGVSVLGTYSGVSLPAAGRRALQRLLAWRLDVAHVDPLSRLTYTTFGNERFREGTRVRLRAISGHRDTGLTSCPGSTLYARLGTIAQTVSRIGLPKLYNPRARGMVGGLVRFTGRLSASRAWRVEVKNAAGDVIASRAGSGRLIDWTWNARRMLFGRYTYTMSSGTAVRRAVSVVPSPPPLRVTGLRLSPRVLTPNGDGQGDRTRIGFSLTTAATARVVVLSGSTPVRTLAAGARLGAGRAAFTWAGRRDNGAPVRDGEYTVRVRAAIGVNRAAASVRLVVDRTLASLSVSPRRFSPNGDGSRDFVHVGFDLAREASVLVRVRRRGEPIATVLRNTLPAGRHRVRWNGRVGGTLQPSGRYGFAVHARTSLGRRSLYGRFVLDTAGPRVVIRSARRANGVTRLRLSLNEWARLTIWYGRTRWNDGTSITLQRRAGEHRIWRRVFSRVVRVQGRDALANVGSPVIRRVRVG
jgi:N-acetylmuramoyl-L-alanine amidase/FlgD Ig-like domain